MEVHSITVNQWLVSMRMETDLNWEKQWGSGTSDIQSTYVMYIHHFETTEPTCLAFELLSDSQGYLWNKLSLNNIHLGHFVVRQKQNVLLGILGILLFILILSFLTSLYMLKTTT